MTNLRRPQHSARRHRARQLGLLCLLLCAAFVAVVFLRPRSEDASPRRSGALDNKAGYRGNLEHPALELVPGKPPALPDDEGPRDRRDVRIAGSVCTPDGHRVGEGEIRALGVSDGTVFSPLPVADGRFSASVTFRAPAQLTLYYRSDAHRHSNYVRVDLAAHDARERLSFVVEEPLRVEVEVSDVHGRPAAGAQVTARGVPYPIEGTTDANGKLTVLVPSGTLGFWARGSDGGFGVSRRALPREPGQTLEHRIRLGRPWVGIPMRVRSAPPGALRGRVARVNLVRMGQSTWHDVEIDGDAVRVHIPVDVTVNGDVRFEGGGVQGFRWEPDDARIREGVTVTVHPMGSLHLVVRGPDGEHLPHFPLHIRGVEADERQVAGRDTEAVTGPDGAVEVTGLRLGAYEIGSPTAPGLTIGRIVISKQGHRLDLRLRVGQAVRGTWRLPSGLPADEDVHVRLWGTSGVFDVPARPDGTWALFVPVENPGITHSQLWAGRVPAGIRSQVADAKSPIHLDASGLAVLRIELVSSGLGKLFPRSVRLKRIGSDLGASQTWTANLMSGESTVLFCGVSAGEYEVRYSARFFRDEGKVLSPGLGVTGQDQIERYTLKD